MAEHVFYEIARWRLERQLAQISELNSRLAVIFTAATALLVLFAAFQDFADLSTGATALIGAGAASYVLLVLVIFLAYPDRRLSLSPDLEELQSHSGSEGEAELLLWVAEETLRAFTDNEPRFHAKRKMTTTALALWSLSVLLLGAATLITT